MKEVVLLAGTRAEAVRIAPVALALTDHPVLRPVVVHSGQGVVGAALRAFGLFADVALDVPRATDGEAELAAHLLAGLDRVLGRREASVVLVQGDSTTALAGAL
ncbi:MAG: UDP-N-acetylglucosamine 2-epimerase (non-hydrolyzing), partial [Saccharothrix sp.]|nr:UDP-N-acetylglucosamine 2-epimerase (non-hydrolyzing) [Saccharothrix sp.]